MGAKLSATPCHNAGLAVRIRRRPSDYASHLSTISGKKAKLRAAIKKHGDWQEKSWEINFYRAFLDYQLGLVQFQT